MEKGQAVESLGKSKLLGPMLLRSALVANDRLKFVLTAIQAACAHARHPDEPAMRLEADYAAARMDASWLLELPAKAVLEGARVRIPELQRVLAMLAEDIGVMARPVASSAGPDRALLARVDSWTQTLHAMRGVTLSDSELLRLTGGDRKGEDTFHILVMDLHKSLNRLAACMAEETIDGAHVWAIEPEDHPQIAAFMAGLNRTKPLKLDHPGLDTAATRDGTRLLIQNDIGTNDAHVLVMEVEETTVSLTYSDLHPKRFAFFQRLLQEIGAEWREAGVRNADSLNAGQNYMFGIARFVLADQSALSVALEEIGERIVFLIDWNRARKGLKRLARGRVALQVLDRAARCGTGHMGWLSAGGAELVFEAMEAIGRSQFRMGERLDDALGQEGSCQFLLDCLKHCQEAALARRGQHQIADNVRVLLIRHMSRNSDQFATLGEMAAICHALSEAVHDALVHRAEQDTKAARKLAQRAKVLERRADDIVIDLRSAAERSERLKPFRDLVMLMDDCADALEEAAFIVSLAADSGHGFGPEPVADSLQALAQRTLEGAQDHVRMVTIADSLSRLREGPAKDLDHEEFLATCWRVVEAEQACDALARKARQQLATKTSDAISFALASDFIAAVESASDALLAVGHRARSFVLDRIETSTLEASHGG
jgi:uncharacterized protein Yka (UPF0111/DUF47 family)